MYPELHLFCDCARLESKYNFKIKTKKYLPKQEHKLKFKYASDIRVYNK